MFIKFFQKIFQFYKFYISNISQYLRRYHYRKTASLSSSFSQERIVQVKGSKETAQVVLILCWLSGSCRYILIFKDTNIVWSVHHSVSSPVTMLFTDRDFPVPNVFIFFWHHFESSVKLFSTQRQKSFSTCRWITSSLSLKFPLSGGM